MVNCSAPTGDLLFSALTKIGQGAVDILHHCEPLIPVVNISLASRFSTPITWDQVANEKSTEKLVQLCKEKIAPPTGFLSRSILMNKKEWIQPLIECGASLEEVSGYVTPALAWASRFPQEAIPSPLQITPYETEILERKLLAHLFEIEGATVVKDKVLSLQGFHPTYFWSRITDITKELGNRNQTLSKIHRLPLFEKAVLLDDKEGIDFKESPIHIIKTGDQGSRDLRSSPHVSALVLSENFIAHVSDGISVGRYISSFLPANIRHLLSYDSLTEEEYQNTIRKLYKETQATPILKAARLNIRPFIQVVGNCAWKTPESSLFAVRLLDTLESFNLESKQTAQKILTHCKSNIHDQLYHHRLETLNLALSCQVQIQSFKPMVV